VTDALTEYFKPKMNVTKLRLQFSKAVQQSNETIDSYLSRLRTLIRHCRYDREDNIILHHMIAHVASERLQTRCLEIEEKDLTLEKLMDIGRRMEHARREASAMGKTSDTRQEDDVRYTSSTSNSGAKSVKGKDPWWKDRDKKKKSGNPPAQPQQASQPASWYELQQAQKERTTCSRSFMQKLRI
jgi:hypothetical protein